MAASMLVWMAFGAALVSAFAYHQSATKKRMMVPLARRSFLVMAAGVVAASVLLMVFILRHQFEYAYVYSYSSRDLPTHLLITAFWAGQEGSFLFWALCSTVIGFSLLNYSRRKHIEYETMAVYALLQAFLLLLLLAKSPFKYIWEAFPTQAQVGTIPPDGKGLNPLLQNVWMVIHPPVLFIGFAAMEVPFAMAVAALWKQSYAEWIVKALPWALFAAIALGAGLMLGGYWAYGVLGWGGWWGWDPVENSSLVPWIVVVALLHTLAVQKKTGKLARTNFALSILGFVLVIYSTFLTRSGVLGDSSVHSFVDPGAFAYSLLVIWMITVAGIGFIMLARRWKELKAQAKSVGNVTRESLISMGAAALGGSALVIFFGTSWPIFSNATVEPSFYDSMNLPIAALMLVILGFSLLVQWRMESLSGLMKRAVVGMASSVAGTVILFFLGATDLSMLALAAASLFAFVINVQRLAVQARINPAGTGGAIAHIGFALLFLGIIGSGRYGQKATVSLPQGEPKEVFGRTLVYSGSVPLEGGKFRFDVNADRNGSSFVLSPVMYQSSYNSGIMREPDYASSLTGDFYLEPVSLESQHDHSEHAARNLVKGESVEIGGKTVTFVRFEMNQHDGATTNAGDGFIVSAVLDIRNGKKSESVKVPSTFRQGSAVEPTPVRTPDGTLEFKFLAMHVDMETKQSSIELSVVDPTAPVETTEKEVLVVEASLKPFMSLVWISALLVVVGLSLALAQSRRQIAVVDVPVRVKSNGEKTEEKTGVVAEEIVAS
ncbi:MAG TPA: cytochrome c biogenesis protein CcsA [Bacteroidota bacterium]